MIQRTSRPAFAWLGVLVAAGAAMALLYRDSYQQDGGVHFLQARWAWQHPWLFVGVWSRPLFTFLYSFPAQLGYPAAKLFTVAVCAVTAWQTWKLAKDLEFPRPHLAIPLLLLQPYFFLLLSDTLTEPIFALVFIVALRLHIRGRVKWGMAVASLMILARPEGFFLGVLWGIWILADRRDARPVGRKIPSTLLLAIGAVTWWLSAWLITGDPLWIKHDWPHDWKAEGGPYGSGPAWWYLAKLSVIVGRFLMIPFLVGLVMLLRRRRHGTLTSSFLCLFILHGVLWMYGGFGSAGYGRYLVCVAPAIALLTLAGWNAIADRLSEVPRLARGAITAVIFLYSGAHAVQHVDGYVFNRDSRLIDSVHAGFVGQPKPFTKMLWSQAYMAIVFDRDPMERPAMTGDRAKNLELIRSLPEGTLVFWDGETGPGWYGIKAADFVAAGFSELRSERATLEGRFFKGTWWWHGGTRDQEMHLLLK